MRQSLDDTPQGRPDSGTHSPFSSASQEIARIKSEMAIDLNNGKVNWQGREIALAIEDPSLSGRSDDQLLNDIAVILFVSSGAASNNY